MLRNLTASVSSYKKSIEYNKYDEYTYAGLAGVLLQNPCLTAGDEAPSDDCIAPVKELLDEVLRVLDELAEREKEEPVEFKVSPEGDIKLSTWDAGDDVEDEAFIAVTANERPPPKSMLHFTIFQLANALSDTVLGKPVLSCKCKLFY